MREPAGSVIRPRAGRGPGRPDVRLDPLNLPVSTALSTTSLTAASGRRTRRRPIELVRRGAHDAGYLACPCVEIIGLRGRAGQRLARRRHERLHVGGDPGLGFE
jgi:hypothetical protein